VQNYSKPNPTETTIKSSLLLFYLPHQSSKSKVHPTFDITAQQPTQEEKKEATPQPTPNPSLKSITPKTVANKSQGSKRGRGTGTLKS
jgi:hypothetical protein